VSRPVRLRLVLAATALLALTATGCGGDGTYYDSSPGQDAPVATAGWSRVDPIKVDLPTADPITDGAAVPDDSVPTLVNIWASWCAPCKHELPLLESIEKTGKLHVIGFSRDTNTGSAADALKAAGVTYPNWLDSDASLAVELDHRVPLSSVPSSVLIRDGKVIAVHIGQFHTRAEVLQALEQR
jgi:thiol-disulfide isomerase/thioredoxin